MTKPKITPAEINYRADCAFNAIASARKQAVFGYDVRLRKLVELKKQVTAPAVSDQPELFEPDAVLSPELSDILAAPLSGL